MPSPRIERALISVSDKTGLAEFARELTARGVEVFSTGGTRRHLETVRVPVHDVSEYTGFPEMMDGRVKTLHPKVFAGIFARRDRPEDMAALAEHGILSFDLVVVNLYPFEATVARVGVTEAEAIENIDIGGPSLVRASAKNFAFVTIATSPVQYDEILRELTTERGTTLELRRRLAAEAFAHTAAYDRAIAGYFAGASSEGAFPSTLALHLTRKEMLRYGENPHQKAALYAIEDVPPGNVVSAEKLHGKELSYNNLLDLDSAMEIVRGFSGPAAVVVKHNNPCGAAEADCPAEALERAMAGDPVSAFGSVLGLNRGVDAATAEVLCRPGLFVEAIAAPDFDAAAIEMLTTRPRWKANVRLVKVGPLGGAHQRRVYRQVDGGMLLQDGDSLADPEEQWKVVTEKAPPPEQIADLRFAFAIVRYVKSNAIAVCKDRTLLATGRAR